MGKYYILQKRLHFPRTRAEMDYIDVDPSNTGDALECKVCDATLSLLEWLPPYRVELTTWGEVWGDLAPGTGEELLISQRFKAMYEERGLKGLEGFHPVEVVKVVRRTRKCRADPPPYYVANVVYTRAAVDDARSGVVRAGKKICPECRNCNKGAVLKIERVVIEAGTWTGEDFAQVRGLPGEIVASARFKRLCVEYNLENVVLIPAERYSDEEKFWDIYDDEDDEAEDT